MMTKEQYEHLLDLIDGIGNDLMKAHSIMRRIDPNSLPSIAGANSVSASPQPAPPAASPVADDDDQATPVPTPKALVVSETLAGAMDAADEIDRRRAEARAQEAEEAAEALKRKAPYPVTVTDAQPRDAFDDYALHVEDQDRGEEGWLPVPQATCEEAAKVISNDGAFGMDLEQSEIDKIDWQPKVDATMEEEQCN